MTHLAENYELLTKMLSSGKVSPKDTDAGGCLFALPETINILECYHKSRVDKRTKR